MLKTIARYAPLFLISLSLGCSDTKTVMNNPAEAATPNGGDIVVVELFQSQGCSSCPPAQSALNKIADRDDIIALSYAVDYWDRLGGKDIFADPAFTNRQRGYSAALSNDGLYTPQVVLNGAKEIVGNGPGELETAANGMPKLSLAPNISQNGDIVSIGANAAGAGASIADIWLIDYDPRIQNVKINAGENGGRTLPHRNIVRQISKLGEWNGKAAKFALPKASAANLHRVIIVQGVNQGAIITARRL